MCGRLVIGAAVCVFLLLAVLFGSIILVAVPQSPHPNPNIVFEVITINHGIGHYRHASLFIRLNRDGSVLWETAKSHTADEQHANKISKEEVAEVENRISSIDPEGLLRDMGPYSVYTDTSVELKFYAPNSRGVTRFTIWNPLPSRRQKIRMPENVKAWVCEAVKLRVRFVHEDFGLDCNPPKEN